MSVLPATVSEWMCTSIVICSQWSASNSCELSDDGAKSRDPNFLGVSSTEPSDGVSPESLSGCSSFTLWIIVASKLFRVRKHCKHPCTDGSGGVCLSARIYRRVFFVYG